MVITMITHACPNSVVMSNPSDRVIEALKAEIASREKELSRLGSLFDGKGAVLRDFLDQLNLLGIDGEARQMITDICLNLIEVEKFEKMLKMSLTESDTDFIIRLQKIHPALNERELKVCLLLKMNYDPGDIARTLDVSIRGMESIRYRMHKKLKLGTHQSIKSYLSEFVFAV